MRSPIGRQTDVEKRRQDAPALWARVCLALLLVTGLVVTPHGSPVRAQIGGPAQTTNVFVTSVDSTSYPQVSAQLYATDATGLPAANVQNTDLTVAVDGVEVAPEDFALSPTSNGGQSMVLVLDASTSEVAWASVMTSAQNLLAAMQPGDAAALVTFSDTTQVQSTLSSDLQQTRNALASVAATVSPNAESHVNQAILDALSLFAVGEAQEPELAGNRRTIVLLTERSGDLDNPPAEQPESASVLQFAWQQGVALNLYAYGAAAAAAQDLLDLAGGSGGRFTPLATAGDANAHFQALPALLRPGYRLQLTLDLPANDSDHYLLVAGAGAQPVERTFVATARPLEVRITRPAEGEVVTGEVIVTVSANTPAPIQSMEFLLENGTVITTTNGAVGGILWDTSVLPAGEQSIIVQAVDAVGNTGQSVRNVEVRAPIALRVETAVDTVQVGESTTITAVIDSAYDGVTVEAFLGRTQVGVVADPGEQAVFTVDTTSFTPGRYALVVRASNSGGYTAADDAHVIAVTAAPAEPTPAQNILSGALAWVYRWWPLLALGALGLLLLIALLAAIAALVRRRRAAAAREMLNVHPQMRILLTNSGNVRTRYRLRAQAKEGEYKFMFLHNGALLGAPALEHVSAAPAAMGNGAAAAPLTQTATQGAAMGYAPQSTKSGSSVSVAQATQAAGKATENAGKVANFASRFLMTAGEAIPGAVGDTMLSAGRGARSVQVSSARAQSEVGEAVGDVRDISQMSKQAGSVASKATGHTASPGPTPTKYQAQPATASTNTAFALQADKSANGVAGRTLSATSATRWVETPPVAPGDTIGVDLYVQPAQGRARNKRVQLRLFATPAEAEGAQPSVDEVSIQLR